MSLVNVFPNNPLSTSEETADETVTDVGDAGSSRAFVAADVLNPDASDFAFLQVFNLPAADVNLGTTPPIAAFAIGPAQSRLCSHGYLHRCPDGMSYAITATRTGSAAPSSACSITLWYV